MVKKEKKATNEFNQEMKSVSLTADAWNRLRKNKMAYASFWIVVVYALVALFAPVLPFYPYAQQNLNHTNLPPSFQKAGDMELVTRKAYFAKVMAKEKRSEYNAEEQAAIASIEERNKTDPEQNRRYLLGTDSLGRDMLSRTVYGGRISIGALSLGIAKGAYEASLKYAKERMQFGKRLIDLQAVGFKLADMATEIEASELLLHKSAFQKNNGQRVTLSGAMAKMYSSEVCVRVATEAIQIHGGYGYTKDFPVEKFFRDSKLCTIGEGTTEIQKLVITRQIDKNS